MTSSQTIRRVYIAGAGGMLGAAVGEHFGHKYEIRCSDLLPRDNWLRKVDVGDFSRFREDVLDFEPDALVNLAAQTDLEFCERNPAQAWRDNAVGAENGVLIANELDVPYVYISTAGIFGGDRDFYNDYDDPHPLTIYGRSKLAGERATLQLANKPYVLRAGWMMGGGPALDKKFVNKIFAQIQRGASVIHAVTDKLGTPTYTPDFARGMETVILSGQYGLYNQVCSGSASRFEVAVEFVRLLGLDAQVEVRPVTSDFFDSEYFAVRPASEQLQNFKLEVRGMNVMRPWRESLAEYAETFRAYLER